MLTPSETEMKIRVTQREQRNIKTTQITYALYRVVTNLATYYAVEVSAANEHDMRMLGENCERAEKLFEILVNETVTPCTLRDVLHDTEILEEEAKYRENLYKN